MCGFWCHFSDNALGHGGRLAQVYGSLMKDMWSDGYTKVPLQYTALLFLGASVQPYFLTFLLPSTSSFCSWFLTSLFFVFYPSVFFCYFTLLLLHLIPSSPPLHPFHFPPHYTSFTILYRVKPGDSSWLKADHRWIPASIRGLWSTRQSRANGIFVRYMKW